MQSMRLVNQIYPEQPDPGEIFSQYPIIQNDIKHNIMC